MTVIKAATAVKSSLVDEEPATMHMRQELRSSWELRQLDDVSDSAWMPVKEVPTQVHTDLLANQRIPDPFLDTNELAVRWIGEKDWVYRVSFETPAPLAGDCSTHLVFKGLDTFATVILNGETILKSDNMHLEHDVDITRFLRPGSLNTLEIVFESALLRGRELIKQHPEHPWLARQTEEGRLPVRKAQYHWGWDWGPILMTAGPWRGVYLEQYTAKLEDLWVNYELAADLKTCSGRVFTKVGGNWSKDTKVLVNLSLEGTLLFSNTCDLDESGQAVSPFQIDQPSLWYPHGYGTQSRYQLSAQIIKEKEVLDSNTKLIGFRRCELVQEPDTYGKSFYIRINDIDIFSGGSCWIPGDSFLASISKKRYHDWIQLLIEGNQNTIRVWGGGIYEDNAFMDACDELGVMVFHDFAFACGNYPAYASYLESIEAEARQNVRRLRSHPSLVLWFGNNEDYQVQEFFKLEYHPEDHDPESWLKTSFPARYIYEKILPDIVKQEDSAVIYHPGSPWGDGKNSKDSTVGDIHQWNIWHGQMLRYQDAETLSGRFVSEFGMEAYPHIETLRRMITNPHEQRPGSLMMDFRNKAGNHERRLMTYVAENLPISYELPAFTHLTQIMQADTMRFAYKSWRRMWRKPGARQCGGALVWQLNDCWPTISWAVVDYYMIKKPAFYAIARALQPWDVGISRVCTDWTSGHNDPYALNKCEYDVWIASSLQTTVEAEVRVRFISIATGQDIRETVISNTTVNSNSTTEVLCHREQSKPDSTASWDWKQWDPYVIHVALVVDCQTVALDTAWPQPLKYLDFSNRKISVEVRSMKEITVSAETPVKGFVFDEREGLHFSDNGFDVMPGCPIVVHVTGCVSIDEITWTHLGA